MEPILYSAPNLHKVQSPTNECKTPEQVIHSSCYDNWVEGIRSTFGVLGLLAHNRNRIFSLLMEANVDCEVDLTNAIEDGVAPYITRLSLQAPGMLEGFTEVYRSFPALTRLTLPTTDEKDMRKTLKSLLPKLKLVELTLHEVFFTPEHVHLESHLASLLPRLTRLHTLNIEANSFSHDQSKEIVEKVFTAIATCSNLTRLALSGGVALAYLEKSYWESEDQLPTQLKSLQIHPRRGKVARKFAIPDAKFASLTNLTCLSLRNTVLPDFALVSDLPNLTQLDLCQCSMGDEGFLELAQALIHLKHLSILDLRRNQVKRRGISQIAASLCELPLTVLHLDQNAVTNAEDLSDALSRLSLLRELTLDSCQLGTEGAVTLALGLSKCVALKRLNLENNEIQCLTPYLMAAIGQLTALEVLTLNSNPIGKLGFEGFRQALPKLTNLVKLNLAEMQMKGNLLPLVPHFANLVYLERLNLDSNQFLRKHVTELALVVPKMPSLRTLEIDNAPFCKPKILKMVKRSHISHLTVDGLKKHEDLLDALKRNVKRNKTLAEYAIWVPPVEYIEFDEKGETR